MNTKFHTTALFSFAVAACMTTSSFGQRTTEHLPVAPKKASFTAVDANDLGPRAATRRADLGHGLDYASPAPVGKRFVDPSTPEAFTGLSDEDLAVAETASPNFAPNRSKVYYTEHADGTWIRGRNYKAHASQDGFTFIPFLGSDAERNWPVEFRLKSAVLDGRALNLDAAAAVSRSGDRLVLDRGPVDVVYDIDNQWIEQSFILDAAGAEGDLVLELDVKSDLAKVSDGAGFQFAGARGGMTYSAAIVLDGAGRTAEVPATLDGDKLSLTVSADFLRTAQGPIVVDPILTTYTVDDVSGDQRDMALAYDRTSDTFTYVYEDTFSAADVDIYSTTVDASGTSVGSRYIDSSSDDWSNPEIANLNSADKHLIVAQRVNGTTGYSEVMGRILDMPTDTLGPELVIGTATANWDNFRPDVGGNASTGAGTVFAVVWERQFSTNTQPRLRTVQPDGTLGLVSFFDSGAYERTGVVISPSTGDPSAVNVWNVAYRSVENATGNESVRGVQLDATGALIGSPEDLWSAPAGDQISQIDISDALDLDGLAPTYAITFERTPSPVEDTLLMFCREGSRVGALRDLHRSEHADLTLSQNGARIGTTAEDFLVTYHELGASSLNTVITTFDLTEDRYIAISERRTLVTDQSILFSDAPIASRFSGGLASSRIVGLGWSEYNGTDLDAHGARFFANAPLAQAFQYGYGNPNSTGDRSFLTMYGDRSTTAPKTLRASALPASSFGFFICGPDMNNVPNPGGSDGVLLVGGSIGRYVAAGQIKSSGANGTFSLDIDPTDLPQPTGSVAVAAGEIWQFQAWHRDTGSGGGGPTSNFTNGVTMLFR
ncbi:hypothetical protein N9L90_00260 [Planctomycetota bacterium]|nr:hypothetical protein [Planctomycetota bacterium]